MSGNVAISWLTDDELSRISGQGPPSSSIMGQRYDASCPSEFYRGYATLLSRVGDNLQASSSLPTLRRLIDEFDVAVKGLSADERRNGASFALMNVASYAQAGTIPQIRATLGSELVCIAHCFFRNRARGI